MYSWLNWKPSFTFLICSAQKEKICLIPGEIIALVFMMDVFHISLNSICKNMGFVKKKKVPHDTSPCGGRNRKGEEITPAACRLATLPQCEAVNYTTQEKQDNYFLPAEIRKA